MRIKVNKKLIDKTIIVDGKEVIVMKPTKEQPWSGKRRKRKAKGYFKNIKNSK